MEQICYLVTCIKSQKSYVGVTGVGVEKRWARHVKSARRGSSLALHRAIRKYGKDAFILTVLDVFSNRADALACEIKMISSIVTIAPHGYNMTPGGDGCVGLCEKSRAKKSKSARLAHARPGVKQRHIDGIVASMTDEARAKISLSKMGKKMHPNAAAGIAAAKKTETCKKIASEAAARTWRNADYRKKWMASKLDNHIKKAKKFPVRDDGLVFSSTRSAADHMRKNGFEKAAPNNICMACNGKYKSSCGHGWSWIDGDAARANGEIM